MGIASQQVLTIGNGYNDISMLNGSVAGLTGCPSNSEAEVMEAVHHSGGHIAGERSLGGVIEVLDAHLMDSVRSELPDWWKAPSLRGGAMPEDILRARKGKRRYARKCLIAATLYTVLMAFASFDLIPLSGLIMKPYRLLMVLLERFLVLISI